MDRKQSKRAAAKKRAGSLKIQYRGWPQRSYETCEHTLIAHSLLIFHWLIFETDERTASSERLVKHERLFRT